MRCPLNRIGITMGDPAGVGPELLVAALSGMVPGGKFEPHLFVDRALLESLAGPAGLPPGCCWHPVAGGDGRPVEPGRYTHEAGRWQLACLQAGADALAAGEIDALVTGPMHKRALVDFAQPGPGQTEWLAARFGVARPVMMVGGPRLKAVLVTTHLPLREVAAAIRQQDVVETVRVASRDLKRFFCPAGARLALCALNPHGEEAGGPGREEREVLQPAAERLRAEGVDLVGPVAADALCALAAAGRFDALVALYHDQGLGPVKALHFSEAVNVTLGLDRVRTAPDHGPAYDLARSGRADPGSLVAAIRTADAMVSCGS